MFPALSVDARAVSIQALPCHDLSVWVSVGTDHNSMADESGNQERAGSSGEGSPQELQDYVKELVSNDKRILELHDGEIQEKRNYYREIAETS